MRELINTPAGARFVDELTSPMDDPGRAVYLTMLNVAERDLTGDALVARRAEIEAIAKAGGWEIPNIDPEPQEVQLYDQYQQSAKMASAAPDADGYPSTLLRSQVEFWRSVTKDAQPDLNVSSELLAGIKAWLQTAAAPAQATELLTMAERSLPVAQALAAYAGAAARYTDGKPR
jgi:hypothetical protein